MSELGEIINSALSAEDLEDYNQQIEQIRERDPDSVFAAASCLIESESPGRRKLGADILKEIDEIHRSDAITRLFPLMQDAESEVAAAAIEALGNLHAVEIIPSLLQMCNHNDLKIREAVASAIGDISSADLSEGTSHTMLETLANMASDPDWEVRYQVAIGLHYYPGDDPIIASTLRQLADDDDPDVRAEAIHAMACFDDAGAVDLLIRELSNSECDYTTAFMSAEESGDPSLLPLLRKLKDDGMKDEELDAAIDACNATERLQERVNRSNLEQGFHSDPRSTEELIRTALSLPVDENDYWVTAELLQYRSTEDVFEAASEMTKSENPRERVLAVDILRGIGVRVGEYHDESVDLMIPLLKDKDVDVVASAAWGIGIRFRDSSLAKITSQERAAEAIMELVEHPCPEVRWPTAHALKWLEDEGLSALTLDRVLRALAGLCSDEDRDVRDEATSALKYSPKYTVEAVEALFQNTHDVDGEIRGEALHGLACAKDPRAVDLIRSELSNRKWVYDATLDAAGTTGDSRLLPILYELKKNGITSRFLDQAIEACTHPE